MRRSLLLVFWLGAIAGCQDYIFEELPSSVIKEKRWTQTIRISTAADILFLIDNSGSMVGEQVQLGQSFGAFLTEIEKYFGKDYHIAVVTTGVQSSQCPKCSEAQYTCPDCVANPTTENCANCSNCMNIESGETGVFQRRLGKNVGTVIQPQFQFRLDDRCGQVITSENTWCFYESSNQEGIAMVGTNGCGYEKGLEALLLALQDNQGAGFIRENATLAIVAVTDEEDCGKVGETSEGTSVGGNICYYAANGQDPEGKTNDPNGLPYRLTPVEKYYEEFMKIKGNRDGMVKFAAIVGVEDVQHPENTTIKFVNEGGKWNKVAACETPHCKDGCPAPGTPLYRNCIEACEAFPGTRYLKMAKLFGGDGFIDTICQNDFSETMKKLGTFVGCPREFMLSEPILDPGLANILINDHAVPRYSCAFAETKLQECSGPSDTSCGAGINCVPTWEYHPPSDPPSPNAPGGTITFASHYDPCEYFKPGESVHIELVYVTP